MLSSALVAFTIEFDNEAERRMRHRTTDRDAGGSGGHSPWLVSMVMWFNCMRFLDGEGLTVEELERQAGTGTNLGGMERWGYITIEAGSRHSERLVRATDAGRDASVVWAPLLGEIEDRWQARFGHEVVEGLRASLAGTVDAMGLAPPDCMPILGYGLWTTTPDRERGAPAARLEVTASLPLPALLARVLVGIAREFERDFELSLAICANVVRVLGEDAVPVRDLPRLTGVSKEAVAMALGVLSKSGHAVVEPLPAPRRGGSVRLTAAGRAAQVAYHQRLASIEERWRRALGEAASDRLRASLERLGAEPSPRRSPLFSGLEPAPQGWVRHGRRR